MPQPQGYAPAATPTPTAAPTLSGLATAYGMNQLLAPSAAAQVAPVATQFGASSVPSAMLPSFGAEAAAAPAVEAAATQGAALPGTGLAGLALPAAFMATAPLYTPLIAKGGDALARGLGILNEAPPRQFNAAEVLRSKLLPRQVPQMAGFDPGQKEKFVQRAHELGLLGMTGRADASGATVGTPDQDRLVFRMPGNRHDGSKVMSIGDMLKAKNFMMPLEDAVTRVNEDARFTEEYRGKVNELASMLKAKE